MACLCLVLFELYPNGSKLCKKMLWKTVRCLKICFVRIQSNKRKTYTNKNKKITCQNPKSPGWMTRFILWLILAAIRLKQDLLVRLFKNDLSQSNSRGRCTEISLSSSHRSPKTKNSNFRTQKFLRRIWSTFKARNSKFILSNSTRRNWLGWIRENFSTYFWKWIKGRPRRTSYFYSGNNFRLWIEIEGGIIWEVQCKWGFYSKKSEFITALFKWKVNWNCCWFRVPRFKDFSCGKWIGDRWILWSSWFWREESRFVFGEDFTREQWDWVYYDRSEGFCEWYKGLFSLLYFLLSFFFHFF